jgi:hypothetical protein
MRSSCQLCRLWAWRGHMGTFELMRTRGAQFIDTSLDQFAQTRQGCRQRIAFALSERPKVTIEHGGSGLAYDLEDRIARLGQFDQDDTFVRFIDAAPNPALRLHGVHESGAGRLTNTLDLGQVGHPLRSKIPQGVERETLGQAHLLGQDGPAQEAIEPRQDGAEFFGQFLRWRWLQVHS